MIIILVMLAVKIGFGILGIGLIMGAMIALITPGAQGGTIVVALCSQRKKPTR